MTRLALAATLALLLLPASAPAAITIGSTAPTGFMDTSESSNSLTIVQTGSPAGGTSYAVPAGNWLVRAVSARVSTTMSTSVAMQYARPVAGAANRFVFQGSDPISVTENSPEAVFTATGLSRRVQGGDLLGITVSNGNSVYSDDTAGYTSTRDSIAVVGGDDTTLTPSPDAGAYAISAVLEPDTDGDGYGDESDDACKLDPEQHVAPCATDLSLSFSVTPTTVQGGQDVTSTTVLTNQGPETASAIYVHIPYGQRFRHGSFPPECENRGAETACKLDSLPAGQSKTFVGKITSISPNTPPQAGSPVTEALSAYVESANRDLNKADNNPAAVGMTVLPIPVGTMQPTKCTVPKLKGKSKSKAASALKKAHCKLGKVKKPKGRLKKGRKLVVKKQSIPAGTPSAEGTKVGITLKAVKK